MATTAAKAADCLYVGADDYFSDPVRAMAAAHIGHGSAVVWRLTSGQETRGMAAGAGIDRGGLAVQDRTLVDGVHRFRQKPAGCPLDNNRTEWTIRITMCLPQRTLLVPAALLADQLRGCNYVNAIAVAHSGLVF